MTVFIINLVASIVIVVLGFWGYSKKKYDALLYIGIAWVIFGVSHILGVLGLWAGLEAVLIPIRVIAYLIFIFAVYRIISTK
jgi:hypothetical protein